jgi:hypothetical protein
MKRYKLTFNGKSYGPLTQPQIAGLYKAGKVPKDARVSEWVQPAVVLEPVLEPAEEDNTRPTERQIAYAEDLGITVRPWMTREQVSDLISAETDGDDYLERQPRYRHRPQQITGHVTTERTGKALKLHQLYAWAMFGIGLLMFWSAAAKGGSAGEMGAMMSFGSLLVVGSFFYGIGNRMVAWWHHG